MTSFLRPRTLPQQSRPLSDASWEILSSLDAKLADRKKRDELSYEALRATLNKVPRQERGLDWTERVITLYCVKRMKGNRCVSLRNRIKEARLAAGDTKGWEAFSARLTETIAPYLLTYHGLQIPFVNRDKAEVVQEIANVFNLLEGQGYQGFINSGTLLGAVRESNLLGHDDDADLAVILKGDTDAEVMNELCLLRDRLNDTKGLAKECWLHTGGPLVKIRLVSGIGIDLFPCYFRNDRAYIWPHTYGDLGVNDILPLKPAKIGNQDFPAPQEPEKMLVLNYGAGWREPDPEFVFPWRAARKKFASLLKACRKQQPTRWPWQRQEKR